MHVLLAPEMLKSAKQTFNISPVGGFFFAKVLLAGEMLKTVSMDVLLAGEMLKTAKAIFSISPVGGLFFENASGWGNVKFFFSKMCFWLGKF